MYLEGQPYATFGFRVQRALPCFHAITNHGLVGVHDSHIMGQSVIDVLGAEGGSYTNESLTETTKTLPEEASLGCLRNPGTWELEQEGPCVENGTLAKKSATCRAMHNYARLLHSASIPKHTSPYALWVY